MNQYEVPFDHGVSSEQLHFRFFSTIAQGENEKKFSDGSLIATLPSRKSHAPHQAFLLTKVEGSELARAKTGIVFFDCKAQARFRTLAVRPAFGAIHGGDPRAGDDRFELGGKARLNLYR